MSDVRDTKVGKLFDHINLINLLGYTTTKNDASQAIAIDGVNAENIQSTGTASCWIDNVLIPSLPADAELDISADTTGDAAGTVIADGYTQWFAVMAIADGTLSVWKAGTSALDGTEVLKVPAYDPTTYVCVALMKIDASGADFTVGTTALTGRVLFVQAIGSILPHTDNLLNQ